MTAPLPVFLLSFNRGAYLDRVIAGYRRQTLPVEIIIHDFGSDDEATLARLAAAEAAGFQVIRAPAITHPDELNSVDRSVEAFFRDRPPGPYAVSDCDVDLGDTASDSLEVYLRLLDVMPMAECVGPMLRIRDIPPDYPLYGRVMNRHCEQFWHREPQWTDLGGKGPVAYQEAPIDTTLAVHRAGDSFRRLKEGVRTYFPYEAAHLDWYLTEQELRQSPYARTAHPSISHWSGIANQMDFGGELLRHAEAIIVERDDLGRLVRRTWRIGEGL